MCHLCGLKWEVRPAVLDEAGHCGAEAVGKFDQSKRLQVGVEEPLVEDVQGPPLHHKIIPGQQVSLLQQGIDGRSHVIDYKRLQT